MELPTFSPKVATEKPDQLSHTLMAIAGFLLLGSIVLSPLIFMPSAPGLLGAAKVYLVILGVVGALVFLSLGILRKGAVTLLLPYTLIAWFAVVMGAVVSSLIGATPQYSLWGDVLDIHTAGFLMLLGVVMGTMTLVVTSKKSALYLYASLLGVGLLIMVHHVLRLVFGPELLSLGFLNSGAASLLGNFNDLGLFLGLIILVVMIAMEQLSLPRFGTWLASGIVVIALILLMVVNFSAVWVVLALFSLALLMYALTKDRFAALQNPAAIRESVSVPSIVLLTLVFAVSVIFLIGGNSLGVTVANITNVSYVEVRPSVAATLDIARNVYQENAFTGIGPNNFADAWRLYKDPSINQTLFWDSSFAAGNGYISTWFVTTGVLGIITWLVFFGLFVFLGLKMLLRSAGTDTFWFFIGTVSFVSSLYIWGMSFVYVPGPTLLIIAATMTGLTLAARQALLPNTHTTYNLATDARSGFVLIVVVMLVIITAIATGYGAVRQYAAAYSFVTIPERVDASTEFDVVQQNILNSFELYGSDIYLREVALYNLGRLNQLLTVPEPTSVEQEQFDQSFRQAVTAAAEAIERKRTDPRNWRALGDVYNTLAAADSPEAGARAREAYTEAQARDPQNPVYPLLFAVLSARAGEVEAARAEIDTALRLKPNFTDAILLLTQLDISEGDLEAAISGTRSLVALEPNNPGRLYQLGVLYVANEDRESAIQAFSAALDRDPSYANARYLRAVQYFELGRVDEAIAELEIVRDLNPDNQVVDTLIEQIRSGEIETIATDAQQINEPTASATNDVTTTNVVPDTDLLSPVNFGGAVESPAAAGQSETPVDTAAPADTSTESVPTE